VPQVEAASDPFAGLPFRALAERMGEAMSPVVQAVSAFPSVNVLCLARPFYAFLILHYSRSLHTQMHSIVYAQLAASMQPWRKLTVP
jgi:hypothetical protein